MSYANVVATLALFSALGGVGYAAAAYTGADIIDGSLTGADVQDKSLGKADIAYNAVGTYELESNSVIGGHVIDGSLTGADVDDNSVGRSDIALDAVGAGELAWNSVNAGHISDGEVQTAEVRNGSLQSWDVASTFTAPSAHNASQLGGLTAASYERRVRRAHVSKAGYLSSGQRDGALSISHEANSGTYRIRFDTDVFSCVPVATLDNDGSGLRDVFLSTRQPTDDRNVVEVQTFTTQRTTSAMLLTDHAFNLVVVC